MDEPIKAQEVMGAVNALRKKLETVGKDSPEFKEIQGKVEKALKSYDDLVQKQTLKFQQDEKDKKELNDRIKDLEKEVAKGPVTVTGKNYKESAEYKSLQKFVVGGFNPLSADEVKTLRSDIDTAGGYLSTPEMDIEIVKTIEEKSPIRSIARVKTIGAKQLNIPKRTAIPTATYEGEAEQNQTGESTYGSETLTAHRLTVTIPYTNDMLIDTNFDLINEINGDVGEAYAVREGNRTVLGSGVKQPEGYTINAAVVAAVFTTSTSGAIVADDMINLTGRLKIGYNPIFVFNRQTLAILRTLKESGGAYIWHGGVSQLTGQAGSIPNTIAGERYVIMQDMAVVAANSLSVAYGDFNQGYRIVDRSGMTIIRDDVTQARNAIINLTFHRYTTGQVILSEAIQLMKTKA